MIGERPTDIGLFSVTVKPACKLRRILYDILPYWQGARPRFTLVFEALADIDHESNYLCAIEYANGQKSKPQWEIQISNMSKGSKGEYTVNEMHLVYTGDTFIIVAEKPLTKDVAPHFESVFLFNVTNRSWLALTILVGILAGVLATFGNWIISLFN